MDYGPFQLCIANGEGAIPGGGSCDGGVTETNRFLSRINELELSDKDREEILTRAANYAEPYCVPCADILDRSNGR